MDAPLVLTTRLDPNEIDKEAHNIDVGWAYPLEFYEATLEYKHPKDIENVMDQVSRRIGSALQYEGFGYTHDTADISEGPAESAYKTLETMIDKMNAQLELARKIRAVDTQDVVSRVITKHFLPDMIGNLKSFSAQSFAAPNAAPNIVASSDRWCYHGTSHFDGKRRASRSISRSPRRSARNTTLIRTHNNVSP